MPIAEEAHPIYIGIETIVVNRNSEVKLKHSGQGITQQIIIGTTIPETHQSGLTHGRV